MIRERASRPLIGNVADGRRDAASTPEMEAEAARRENLPRKRALVSPEAARHFRATRFVSGLHGPLLGSDPSVFGEHALGGPTKAPSRGRPAPLPVRIAAHVGTAVLGIAAVTTDRLAHSRLID